MTDSSVPVLTTQAMRDIQSAETSLQLFEVLTLLEPKLTPSSCKVHLAVHNGKEDPLDVYVAGGFDAWQSWQKNENFQRDHVVSLIALPGKGTWLFVGAYLSKGCDLMEDPRHFEYDLVSHEAVESLSGRLVVRFERSGRQSYLLAENWAERMIVSEIRPTRLQLEEFPGYSKVLLSKCQLDIIVERQIASWKAALSSVGGVYVISDSESGKLYVGSATGSDGIWGRWCDYSTTGHGDNKELVQLLREKGAEHAKQFRFGVLEIADSHASQEDTLRRESHWKELLLSRSHGYNGN
jgi:hypothetical protein